jgi:sugar lactone lactonase YvrE
MNLLRKSTLATMLIFCVCMTSVAFAATLTSKPLLNGDGQALRQIMTIAGNGIYDKRDGLSASASFRMPKGLALDSNGTLYIADSSNNLIRALKKGQVDTYAGSSLPVIKTTLGNTSGALWDGSRYEAMFNTPSAVTVGADGSLYIADSDNNVIRKIDTSGKVSTLSGNGVVGLNDGKGTSASFDHPEGIAVTKTGTVFVADTLNNLIRRIEPDGTTTTLNATSRRVVEIYPGYIVRSGDYQDGALAQALFNEPTGLVLDSKGNLFVSDSGNQRIRYIDLNTQQVNTVAGGGNTNGGTSLLEKNSIYVTGLYINGSAMKAAFNSPKGIALDSAGGLIIADSLNHVIRYFINGMVSTLAGDDRSPEAGMHDGIESSAKFNTPSGVAVTSDGTLFVADSGNNRIRQINYFQLPSNLPHNNVIKVVLDNKLVIFDVDPVRLGGKVMVPIRQIAEALGYRIKFSANGQTILLSKGTTTIELSIDEALFVHNNRTFVPVRLLAEAIGLDVQWSKELLTVILRNK